MSIPNGFVPGRKNRPITSRDSNTDRRIYDITQAIECMQCSLAATTSSGNTPAHYSLGTSATLDLAASTYKAISWQVITGTLTVVIVGGNTVAYPAGSIINFVGDKITPEFTFSMSSGGSDSALVQTIA